MEIKVLKITHTRCLHGYPLSDVQFSHVKQNGDTCTTASRYQGHLTEEEAMSMKAWVLGGYFSED